MFTVEALINQLNPFSAILITVVNYFFRKKSLDLNCIKTLSLPRATCVIAVVDEHRQREKSLQAPLTHPLVLWWAVENLRIRF